MLWFSTQTPVCIDKNKYFQFTQWKKILVIFLSQYCVQKYCVWIGPYRIFSCTICSYFSDNFIVWFKILLEKSEDKKMKLILLSTLWKSSAIFLLGMLSCVLLQKMMGISEKHIIEGDTYIWQNYETKT